MCFLIDIMVSGFKNGYYMEGNNISISLNNTEMKSKMIIR
jgi:hypothetical protein